LYGQADKKADADRQTGDEREQMQIEEQGKNGEADRGKVRRCRQTKGADADMQAADADIRTGENADKGIREKMQKEGKESRFRQVRKSRTVSM
jgi:hypothetical protein